jgi:hypothetical protein
LNQFINVAVTKKVAHLQHGEWAVRRAKPTEESIAKALEIPDRPTGQEPEGQDRLPKGYVSVRRMSARVR